MCIYLYLHIYIYIYTYIYIYIYTYIGKTKRESVLSVVVEESRKNSFDGFLKDGFNEEKEDIQII
jgi:uncharacterized ion transporter superfamily protein YfcC